jgi:hypothetical protein
VTQLVLGTGRILRISTLCLESEKSLEEFCSYRILEFNFCKMNVRKFNAKGRNFSLFLGSDNLMLDVLAKYSGKRK